MTTLGGTKRGLVLMALFGLSLGLSLVNVALHWGTWPVVCAWGCAACGWAAAIVGELKFKQVSG
jgi:ABC-type uncharacterized transport system permease subunit